MDTMTTQQVFSTPLPLQEALAKLQAHENVQSPASLFTKREEKLPVVSVKISQGRRISLRQCKTYFNPWAPTFEATLLEKENQGTIIQGVTGPDSKLRPWFHLYYAVLVGGAYASLTSLHALLIYALPKTWVIGEIFSITLVVGLMIGLVTAKNYCQRRYKKLAQGEDAFIMSFLEETLQTREISKATDEDAPDETLQAA
jgi:hypothetical protein